MIWLDIVYIVYDIQNVTGIYNIQNGNTALILASMNGHKDIVSLLLSITNIDVNKQNNVRKYIYIYKFIYV